MRLVATAVSKRASYTSSLESVCPAALADVVPDGQRRTERLAEPGRNNGGRGVPLASSPEIGPQRRPVRWSAPGSDTQARSAARDASIGWRHAGHQASVVTSGVPDPLHADLLSPHPG